jgi:predicted metal-binding membrane protein
MVTVTELLLLPMAVARAQHTAASRLNPVTTAIVILAAALVAWLLAVDRMRGMDAGPGTDLGGLGWFLGIWVTMMAAMMLPSVAPMVLAFARVNGGRSRRGHAAIVPTWIFVAGYLTAWTAYGLLAYGVFRVVMAIDGGVLAWDRAGPYAAGGAIVAAGLYQLTPVKDICLRHCRTPLHFFFHGWHEGKIGAVRMGAEHGVYCVGCCWGLMVVLFSLGVMSLFWMAVIAGVIFAEKVLSHGTRLTRLLAVAFVALGVWIALSPGSVPGLTEPGSGPSMGMKP